MPGSNTPDRLVVMTGTAHPALARGVCNALGIPLTDAGIGRFADNEVRAKLAENVRGADVFFIQPTHATPTSASDNWFEVWVALDAIVRASPHRVTVVLPYVGYGRQDRKDQPRVPITAAMVLDITKERLTNRILTVDMHSAQSQGAIKDPFDHLYARPALMHALRMRELSPIAIGTADITGAKFGKTWAHRLNAPLVIVDKDRIDDNRVEAHGVIGDPRGFHVVIVDDEISTGDSLCKASEALKDLGALSVRGFATHGKFVGDANARIDASPLEEVVVTDSLPQKPGTLSKKIHRISMVPLLALAVRALHGEQSISALFDEETYERLRTELQGEWGSASVPSGV